MNKNKRKKILILSGTGVALLAIMTGVAVAANIQSGNLDLLFPGEKSVKDTGEGLEADYIDYKYTTQADALKNAQDVTQEIAEEGMALLKNEDNALPLAKKAKITILGYYSWHNNMSGGEDPATTSGAISLGKGLENAFDTNAKVNEIYSSARGELTDPASSLDEVKDTFATYNTAIITIKRNSGEGNDQSLDSGTSEYNRTGLSINNAELALVDYASKNFNKVIIVINSANTMELGFLDKNDPNMSADGQYTDPYSKKVYDFSKVKGAIWAGCCGSQGGTALANILNGSVNPSGHLVDAYARTLRNNPSYCNFGSFKYSNSASLNSYQQETYFVEYEEGIYVGYRYYETAAYEALNDNYSGFDYSKEVVYPFGYGLSYTTFSLEYDGTPTYDEATGKYHFDVNIKNTGSVKGKGVAQIYVNVPYKNGQVEKAHVVLGGFAKTSKALEPGETEKVSIEIQEDYIASYDYKTEKAYVLDEGTYNFYLSSNSHSWAEIAEEGAASKEKHLWSKSLSKKVVFSDSKDGKRKTDLKAATNVEDNELNYKFKDYNDGSVGDGYAHNFTRSNFKDSFPSAPTGSDLVLSDSRALKQVAKYDVWDDANNPISEMPEANTDKTSYTLAEMRGVDFSDSKWDDYMNQFTVDKMAEMFSNGGWNEIADEENGVPISYDADSPYGFYAHALTIKDINKWYCGAPMVAATFDTSLARKMGDALAEESHCNYLAGGSLITGLYGFGANTHRSAFGGRNYEYYSEDPLLSGKMAASAASGASEKGLITFMKHYVLNDQETNRQKNGYCAWVNEQAFREIYVKPFEIYIKEAKMEIKYYGTDDNGKYVMKSKEMNAATGIMTCYNRIGAKWGGASDSLQGILEDECGYTGTNVTDAGGEPTSYMNTDQMLRAGGHLTLSNNGTNGLYDKESATAIYHLKDACKHILYNKANSNCVQGIAPGASITYSTPVWRIWEGIAWSVVGAAVLAEAVVITLIATNKIKVKEETITIKNDDSSDEF